MNFTVTHMSLWLNIITMVNEPNERWLHLFSNRLFASFALLFKLSDLAAISDVVISLLSVFNELRKSMMESAIWLDVFFRI